MVVAAIAPLVTCRGVELRGGDRVLVSSLDLDLRAGERWALLGRNGAGKSTLLRVLAGLAPAAAGEVLIAGRPARAGSARELAASRALLPDRWIDPFAVDVLQVVVGARYRFGADPDDQRRAVAALEEFDVAALADRDLRSLSRGERQRVAIATALVQDAPLLLLDEPTSHQDPGHAKAVLSRLAAHPERAICASLHDINAALRFATHVVLLDGRGGWRAGPAGTTVDAGSLAEAFGTRFESVATGRGRAWLVE